MGVDRELHIGAASVHANLSQHCERRVAHDLVFLVGQRLGRCNGDGVAGVHSHRVEVLDRADDDAVVGLVTHNFHLVLFPPQERFFNQQLVSGRSLQTTLANHFKFFGVVGDSATCSAQGEARSDHRGKTHLFLHRPGLFERMRDARSGRTQPDLGHGLLELLAVFGLVDGLRGRANEFDLVFFEHAVVPQVERAIERRLSTHGGQDGIGFFAGDDLFDRLPGDGLDIGGVGGGRVGHDRRRIAVDQNDLVAFVAQGFAGLHAGVVELTGLADDDRASTDDEYALDVLSLGHFLTFPGLVHQASESVEQVADVVRAGRGLRVTLEAKRGLVGAGQPLQRAVKQARMGGAQVGGQGLFVHRETVVLAGDRDAAGVEVLDRVVGTVVAKLHLEGGGARSQREDLVAQADAEGGVPRLDEFMRGGNGVVARLRVTRAVREEHAIGLELLDLGCRGLGGHHRDLATALGEHAQNVFLDAEVKGHHVVARILELSVAGAEFPFGLSPFRVGRRADHLGQIQSGHSGRGSGLGERLVLVGLRQRLARGQGQDAAVLSAAGSQKARELAGVDVGDAHRAFALKVGRQRQVAAKVGGDQRQIANDQARGMDLIGFDVFLVDAVIADVGIRQGDDLPAITRIGEDFLVAGQRRVEHDFAGGGAGGSDRSTDKDCAVCERQEGDGLERLVRQKHWVLRMVTGTPKRLPRRRSMLLLFRERGCGWR